MQDSLIKKIIKNAGIVFLGNSTASALNLVSFTLMARAIGPEMLAVFVLAQTYSLLVNDIFNIQTWESMVKFGSLGDASSKFLNIVKTNLMLDSVSAVVAFSLAMALVYPASLLLGWDNSNATILCLYTGTILFNITSLTIGIPRLFNKFKSIAKIQIAMSIMKIVSVSIVYFINGDFLYYVLIYLSIEILTNLSLITFSLFLLRKKLGKKWWKIKTQIDREQIRFIWWTNLRTIVRIPVRRFDVIVISSVMSLHVLGLYKVYKEVTSVIERIGEPVNQAIYPEFTKLIGRKKTVQSIIVAKKTILLMSGVSFFLTMLLLVSSKVIVGTFFGNEYLEYINALYLMIILSGISFATLPINSLFIAAGFVKYSFYIVVFTNAVYIAVAFSCGSIWGVFGVILANAIQMLLNQSLKFYLLSRKSTGWSCTIR